MKRYVLHPLGNPQGRLFFYCIPPNSQQHRHHISTLRRFAVPTLDHQEPSRPCFLHLPRYKPSPPLSNPLPINNTHQPPPPSQSQSNPLPQSPQHSPPPTNTPSSPQSPLTARVVPTAWFRQVSPWQGRARVRTRPQAFHSRRPGSTDMGTLTASGAPA